MSSRIPAHFACLPQAGGVRALLSLIKISDPEDVNRATLSPYTPALFKCDLNHTEVEIPCTLLFRSPSENRTKLLPQCILAFPQSASLLDSQLLSLYLFSTLVRWHFVLGLLGRTDRPVGVRSVHHFESVSILARVALVLEKLPA